MTDNRVAGNYAGIVVVAADGGRATGNEIVGNAATANRTEGDLVDRWRDCAHNTWRGNQFTVKSADCIR